jgi:hypothetical protein
MADQNARRDENRVTTLLGVNTLGELRNVNVNDQGAVLMTTTGGSTTVPPYVTVNMSKAKDANTGTFVYKLITTDTTTGAQTLTYFDENFTSYSPSGIVMEVGYSSYVSSAFAFWGGFSSIQNAGDTATASVLANSSMMLLSFRTALGTIPNITFYGTDLGSQRSSPRFNQTHSTDGGVDFYTYIIDVRGYTDITCYVTSTMTNTFDFRNSYYIEDQADVEKNVITEPVIPVNEYQSQYDAHLMNTNYQTSGQVLKSILAWIGTKATTDTIGEMMSNLRSLSIVSNSQVGDQNEVAPGNDTATSGINGRLQRIAQNITTLISKIPTTLGNKPMAASLSVTISNDQSVVPTNNTQIKGIATSTGSGVIDTGTQRVTLPTNSPTFGVNTPATAPAQMALVGGIYNATPPVLTSNQSTAMQLDSSGQIKTNSTLGAVNYVISPGNTSSAQILGSGAYIGLIESALAYPQIIVSIRCDRNYTFTVEEFSDAGGTVAYGTNRTYTRLANEVINQPYTVSGSYFRVKVQNNSGTATTNFYCETFLGQLLPIPNPDSAGNMPVSLGNGIPLIDSTPSPTIAQIANYNSVFNGTTWDRQRGTVNGAFSAITNIGSNTTGAYNIFRNEAVLASPVTVKFSQGNIYGLNIINTNTVPVYLKMYNSPAPVVGTTTPQETIAIPASGAFYIEPKGAVNSYFSTAIVIAATTGALLASTTAPTVGLVFEAKYF